MWWQKKIHVLLIIFLAGIAVGGLAMWTVTSPKTIRIEELPPRIGEEPNMETTVSPVLTPTPKPGLKYEIPTSWKTYDKMFQKVRFGFRYPGSYPIQDGDEASGMIYLVGVDGQYVLKVGRLAYLLDGSTEYSGGSRREWYIKLFKESLPFNMAYKEGDLIFTPVEFANGNSWYEVKARSGEKQNYLFGCGTRGRTYYGVYNNVAVIVCDHRTMSQENVFRVMQTLTVR